VKAGKVRLGAGISHRCRLLGEPMRAIPFILVLAASGAFLSGVVTSYALSAQTRPPIAVEQPIARDVPAVSRTSSEKAMDKLDTQLSKKLNVCRGC
jgi:hypothetical protein